ncbi:MAG: CrcB family protein [Sporolactobacillus sp.]
MYYILFAFFGIIGACSRYSLELLIPFHSYPVATLIINLFGCFLLAFVTRFLIWVPGLSQRLVSAIGTGFVGSFTTFSTFTLENAQLLNRGAYIAAASYLVFSIGGGLAACALGYRLSKMLLIHRKRRSNHAD